MVPRWQFVLKAVLFGVSVLIVALIAVYLLSFVLFVLHETGIWFAPGFGLPGIFFFVIASPWMLISLVGIFLLILYFLVAHYSFSYRKPLVYSLIGVVLFVIAVSSLIQYTTVHKRINAFVERHEIPGLAPLYRGLTKERPGSMVVGTVEAIDKTEIKVVTERAGVVEVELSSRTKLPPNKSIEIGDEVMVFGNFQGDDLIAFGVRHVSDGLPPPPKDAFAPGGQPPRVENVTTHQEAEREDQVVPLVDTRIDLKTNSNDEHVVWDDDGEAEDIEDDEEGEEHDDEHERNEREREDEFEDD